MADERSTPLNQGVDKWLQITDGGKLQTWNGVDTPTPIIGDDPLVTKTELDDKASLSLNHGYVSEYTSRVMQEGGTIQNGRRTAAPFISPTYEDAKMLLNASGGLDIADDGGRKVVNKIWDSSQEKENPTFAGSDRPEFTDYNGFESVDVEKEATNYIEDSEITNPTVEGGITVTQDSIMGLGGVLAELDAGLTGSASSGSGPRFNVSQAPESFLLGQTATISFFVEQVDGFKDVEFWLINLSDLTNFRLQPTIDITTGAVLSTSGSAGFANLSVKSVSYGGGVYLISASFELTTDAVINRHDFTLKEESGKMKLAAIQFERGMYPTNPIITQGSPVTRLAPIPVIENALPETGTVGFVTDFVNGGGAGAAGFSFMPIFTSENTSLHSGFQFFHRDGGSVRLIQNSDASFDTSSLFSGTIVPNNFERGVWAFVISYKQGELVVFAMSGDGVIYRALFESPDIIAVTGNARNIQLGARNNDRQLSHRFEKPWRKDNIVRVNATDEEIKQFFEDLTRGTSMEMKASEMEIVA